MFDNCFTFMLLGLLIVMLLFNNNLLKNKNCMLLLFVGVIIIGVMILDNQNNDNKQEFKNLEKFDPNNLAPVDEVNKPILNQQSQQQLQQSQQQTQQQSQQQSQQQTQQQQTNQLMGNSRDDNNFDLSNSDYTLNVNPNDPKYTNNNEPKKALNSKDLLPGAVVNSKDKFDSFTDLFNYDKALELDIAENKLGVDTIGQSKRNASQDLREAPVCPKFNVGPWNNSTIEPDNNIKSLY
jgi:hypothetical protein